ncbi:hypothetical protein A2U01_0108093, partial [Trifolium medium]|nr:hypothetical protein [Trifolium medium]
MGLCEKFKVSIPPKPSEKINVVDDAYIT